MRVGLCGANWSFNPYAAHMQNDQRGPLTANEAECAFSLFYFLFFLIHFLYKNVIKYTYHKIYHLMYIVQQHQMHSHCCAMG